MLYVVETQSIEFHELSYVKLAIAALAYLCGVPFVYN